MLAIPNGASQLTTAAPRWTFITNHGLVLSYLLHNPRSTAREIANYVGVTQRTTYRIRTRQRWISEQRERLERELDDIRRYSFSPESVELLRQRLEARLAAANADDRRFILEAVCAEVIVQADGAWKLQLQIPRQVPEPAPPLQVVNSRPGSNST